MKTGNILLAVGGIGLGVWYVLKKTRGTGLQPSESYPEGPSFESYLPGGYDAATPGGQSTSSGEGYTADSMGVDTRTTTSREALGQEVVASTHVKPPRRLSTQLPSTAVDSVGAGTQTTPSWTDFGQTAIVSTDTTADKALAERLEQQRKEEERLRREAWARQQEEEHKRALEQAKVEAGWARMQAEATEKRIAEARRLQDQADAAAKSSSWTGSSLPETFGVPATKAAPASVTSTVTTFKAPIPPREPFKVAVYKSPVTSVTKTVTASPKAVTALTKASSVDQSGVRAQVGDGIARAAATVKAPVVALRAPMQAMRGVYAIGADLTEAEFLAMASKARLETVRREWAANQLAEQIAGLTYGRY